MLQKALVIIWLLAGFPSVAAGESPSAEYSAEQTTKIDKMVFVSKIYVQGEKTRTETQQNPQQTVSILRRDKGVLWVLWPQMKAYTETQSPVPRTSEGKEERQFLGTEQVNGYQTQKFKVTGKDLQGQPIVSYQWVAKELGGLVVRRQLDGALIELRNVVIAPQPPDLFEIPEGFNKISLKPQRNK